MQRIEYTCVAEFVTECASRRRVIRFADAGCVWTDRGRTLVYNPMRIHLASGWIVCVRIWWRKYTSMMQLILCFSQSNVYPCLCSQIYEDNFRTHTSQPSCAPNTSPECLPTDIDGATKRSRRCRREPAVVHRRLLFGVHREHRWVSFVWDCKLGD